MDGIMNISGGRYDRLLINGVCNCNGDVSGEVLDVDGVLNCEGAVDVALIDCDGVANIRGDVKAEQIEVDGVLNVGKTGHGVKIEAQTIRCDGCITADAGGEISAELIEAEGFIKAGSIVGERVVIRSKRSILMRWLQRWISKVELIEATSIELVEVTADTVNGHDVRIGPRCVIQNVDCSGTLAVDPTATVANVTGTYTTA
jgi:cytoskeletal protein CcmA (bactofilin family)